MPPLAPSYGPIGRLGRWTATHFKLVAIAWVVIAVGLGAFAPKVEHALSGAGWEATGSESLQVRETVDREFGGLSSSALMVVVHSDDKTATNPAFKSVVAEAQDVLAADARVTKSSPSPVTATPPSCRPAPARARTRWSEPPTTSRRSSRRCPRTGCRSR
jgi:RND superfamily putative drug exporter